MVQPVTDVLNQWLINTSVHLLYKCSLVLLLATFTLFVLGYSASILNVSSLHVIVEIMLSFLVVVHVFVETLLS